MVTRTWNWGQSHLTMTNWHVHFKMKPYTKYHWPSMHSYWEPDLNLTWSLDHEIEVKLTTHGWQIDNVKSILTIKLVILGIMVHKIYIKVYAAAAGKVTPMSCFRDYLSQARQKTEGRPLHSWISDPKTACKLGVLIQFY